MSGVNENLDGAIMEEIGSPAGEHVEYVDDFDIMEPDVSFVHDGEIVEDELEEESSDDEPEVEDLVEEVESPEQVVDGERSEASPDEVPADTPEGAPVGANDGASPEEQTRDPFTLNVDGQSFDVPDAYVDGDNIVIPRDSFQRVIQPRVADRGVWQQERKDFQRHIEELAPERNPEVIKAKTLLNSILEVLEDDQKADAFFSDFAKNRDKLILQAERAELEAQRNQLTSTQQRDTAKQEAAELPVQMDSALGNVLSQAKEIADYSSVDMDYVRDLIEPIKGSFFFRADADMPEAGLKKGEIGVRIDLIEQVIQKEAKRSQATQAAQEARKRNETALGNTSSNVSAPPALKPDNPVEVEETPKIETKEQWQARMAAIAAGR